MSKNPKEKILKIGIVAHKFMGDKEKTVQKTVELIEKVASNGAKLVLLQELHQGQYFCQNEDVELFDLANQWQEDIKFWGDVARKFGVVLVTSLFEKRTAGLYHNTAVVFESDGSVAGKYRKMHIPDDPNFYEKFYFTPGDMGYEPINTSVGKLGVLVCWDQWYPEAARLMSLAGAEILIYPTAIGWFDGDDEDEKARQLEAWVAVQRGHAVANGVPVVAINRVGFEEQCLSSGCKNLDSELNLASKTDQSCNQNRKILEKSLNLNAENSKIDENSDSTQNSNTQNFTHSNEVTGIRFWGNSFVFGPQGEEIFRANSSSELAKIVTIDLQRCENVRRWWPFLRDRRVDSYGNLTKRFID
ncbi:carbon-nitrogen hydrolase [Campylobacter geochelonis]|uniref:Carbon-nitrogen family hydrolase n=1 Tax=Campylobacter geochelonis TaxID=1780362 RepID=A0A128EK91_9BACT|nr:carbon-nitrogen hydrolase [Campylobacter geochelonis]QKF71588.1 N-carbamoylputrescine amidohydrolase [Campylobacter geochelonis]CZE48758.1 carbon-nitrogen family hydrolase [Campylobacter geochelonis]